MKLAAEVALAVTKAAPASAFKHMALVPLISPPAPAVLTLGCLSEPHGERSNLSFAMLARPRVARVVE